MKGVPTLGYQGVFSGRISEHKPVHEDNMIEYICGYRVLVDISLGMIIYRPAMGRLHGLCGGEPYYM